MASAKVKSDLVGAEVKERAWRHPAGFTGGGRVTSELQAGRRPPAHDQMESSRNSVRDVYDESYFVGGEKSNYADYGQLREAIERGFMPEVLRYAEHVADGRTGKSCLDIGCAFGFYVERLAGLGWDAAGVDVSEYAIARGKTRGVSNLYVASAQDLPFADGSFDLVTSIDVIEHIPPHQSRVIVAEAMRVLKKGGLAFFATPNFLTNCYWNIYTRGFEDADKTHVNYQSVESLRDHFADFSVCHVYGHTPFVDQFHAFDTSGAFDWRVLQTWPIRPLLRQITWKLLGRSVEYSSYLHAVAIK
jgi:2-polyprenyl-3-methyl-5-hydroxy-6-metoxy-1,4-benzoquinol methylase